MTSRTGTLTRGTESWNGSRSEWMSVQASVHREGPGNWYAFKSNAEAPITRIIRARRAYTVTAGHGAGPKRTTTQNPGDVTECGMSRWSGEFGQAEWAPVAGLRKNPGGDAGRRTSARPISPWPNVSKNNHSVLDRAVPRETAPMIARTDRSHPRLNPRRTVE